MQTGTKIIFLVPETEEDVKELERRINAGEVDQRDSFADDPSECDDGSGGT
jgi:hypothetical protein